MTGNVVNIHDALGKLRDEAVTVLDVGTEAGRRVLDYIDANGRQRWAYDWQARPVARGWSDSTLIACLVGADAIERGRIIRQLSREEPKE